ncbi:hypothetical protein C0J52_03948 [Blattella germanica]|nr:hypothetical protein C0J52_03948 [Blattella germanica]
MQDMQTKFVQPLSSLLMVRNRRNADDVYSWDTYQGNATSDVIIWNVKETEVNTGSSNSIINSDDHFGALIQKIIGTSNFSLGHKDKLPPVPNDNQFHQNAIINDIKLPENSLQQEHHVTSTVPSVKEYVDNGLTDIHQNEGISEDYGNNDNDERIKEAEVPYDEPEVNKVNSQSLSWKNTSTDSESNSGTDPLTTEDRVEREPDDHNTFTIWFSLRISFTAMMMMSYMDENTDPCQDFYQYACGNWGEKNPIPKDKAAYDTFEMLRENLDIVLKELLEEKTNSIWDLDFESVKNDAILKARHLYQSCMNYEILEERAEKPLVNLLDELGGWPMIRSEWDDAQFDWTLLMAQLRLYNNDILIAQWVGPDIKNSDEYVIQFDQTSLGLPTRDYFLQPSNIKYLEAYKNYLIKVSTLLGAPLFNATKQAEEIVDFETKLAKITSSPDERRNVSELYQRMTVGELKQYIPQIDWNQYLSIILARPVNFSEPVVIFALDYIQDLVTLIGKTPSRTVANYLLWRFIRHRVNNLDDRFQDAKQKFYYILFGREQSPSRWKNCVVQTILMTEEIMQSFQELLIGTTWIDKETKELAAQKVDAMSLRIGYPDYILNSELLNERYENLEIHPEKFFENTLNILKHVARVEQDHLGTRVNKSIWNTAPAVVNAYYSRNKNQIMFPAGILQPPFYHRYFPRSLNYGGIGVVIGHEITHGFDDKGRLFDKDGNLHRWWHDEAIEGFHKRAQCLIGMYESLKYRKLILAKRHVMCAYQKWVDENGDFNETLPGLNATGHQLFFLNFAQIWCGSMRPEATRNKLKTAVHSPGKFRYQRHIHFIFGFKIS